MRGGGAWLSVEGEWPVGFAAMHVTHSRFCVCLRGWLLTLLTELITNSRQASRPPHLVVADIRVTLCTLLSLNLILLILIE
jgi:hypothetical protein